MLSFVPLHPTMTYEQMVSTMNENFVAMQNFTRTAVYRDEHGDDRIMIGQFPDGNWGIVMVKEGENVLDVFG